MGTIDASVKSQDDICCWKLPSTVIAAFDCSLWLHPVAWNVTHLFRHDPPVHLFLDKPSSITKDTLEMLWCTVSLIRVVFCLLLLLLQDFHWSLERKELRKTCMSFCIAEDICLIVSWPSSYNASSSLLMVVSSTTMTLLTECNATFFLSCSRFGITTFSRVCLREEAMTGNERDTRDILVTVHSCLRTCELLKTTKSCHLSCQSVPFMTHSSLSLFLFSFFLWCILFSTSLDFSLADKRSMDSFCMEGVIWTLQPSSKVWVDRFIRLCFWGKSTLLVLRIQVTHTLKKHSFFTTFIFSFQRSALSILFSQIFSRKHTSHTHRQTHWHYKIHFKDQ